LLEQPGTVEGIRLVSQLAGDSAVSPVVEAVLLLDTVSGQVSPFGRCTNRRQCRRLAPTIQEPKQSMYTT
jgi:hypothetical protein